MLHVVKGKWEPEDWIEQGEGFQHLRKIRPPT